MLISVKVLAKYVIIIYALGSNEIKGTNHTRRFQTLRDELKKYCHAIDFNETVALCP